MSARRRGNRALSDEDRVSLLELARAPTASS